MAEGSHGILQGTELDMAESTSVEVVRTHIYNSLGYWRATQEVAAIHTRYPISSTFYTTMVGRRSIPDCAVVWSTNIAAWLFPRGLRGAQKCLLNFRGLLSKLFVCENPLCFCTFGSEVHRLVNISVCVLGWLVSAKFSFPILPGLAPVPLQRGNTGCGGLFWCSCRGLPEAVLVCKSPGLAEAGQGQVMES
jgi:hypothetical protein